MGPRVAVRRRSGFGASLNNLEPRPPSPSSLRVGWGASPVKRSRFPFGSFFFSNAMRRPATSGGATLCCVLAAALVAKQINVSILRYSAYGRMVYCGRNASE